MPGRRKGQPSLGEKIATSEGGEEAVFRRYEGGESVASIVASFGQAPTSWHRWINLGGEDRRIRWREAQRVRTARNPPPHHAKAEQSRREKSAASQREARAARREAGPTGVRKSWLDARGEEPAERPTWRRSMYSEPEETRMTAEEVRQWRERHQLTQDQMGTLLGLKARGVVISSWENGRSSPQPYLSLALRQVERDLRSEARAGASAELFGSGGSGDDAESEIVASVNGSPGRNGHPRNGAPGALELEIDL